jgi:hypothetical protein
VYIFGVATPEFVRCQFDGNIAVGGGGGYYEREGTTSTFTDCIFNDNEADIGGGMYNVFDCSPILTGCTFAGNSAATRAGGLRIYTNSNTIVDRCLFWGNASPEGPQIALWSTSLLTIDCSDVDGGQEAVFTDSGSTINWGPGNIDAFPYFCDWADFGLAAGISPCLPGNNSCGVLMGARGVGCDDLSGAPEDGGAPLPVTRLLGAYPNPFNPRTEVCFMLDRPRHVRLVIFDPAGRRVRVLLDEDLPAGAHTMPWAGRNDTGRGVASGTYLLRLETEGYRQTQKIMLLK